jgi:hypothetical protein
MLVARDFLFRYDTEMELVESSVAQLATATPVADWPMFGLGLSNHK